MSSLTGLATPPHMIRASEGATGQPRSSSGGGGGGGGGSGSGGGIVMHESPAPLRSCQSVPRSRSHLASRRPLSAPRPCTLLPFWTALQGGGPGRGGLGASLRARGCGAVVENLPANAGDTGSSPGLGGSHVPWSSWAREPQLLSLRSRAHEPQLLSPCTTTTGPTYHNY